MTVAPFWLPAFNMPQFPAFASVSNYFRDYFVSMNQVHAIIDSKFPFFDM
jgi:hypothetical protein